MLKIGKAHSVKYGLNKSNKKNINRIKTLGFPL